MSDPVRLHKKFNMGKTKEAMISRMLKMNYKDFTEYTTSLQRPTAFREKIPEKSESLRKKVFAEEE